jgi:hypothetical protein
MRDILFNLNLSVAAPLTVTGAAAFPDGAIDTRNFGALSVYLGTSTVTVAGTAGFTMKLQHSDTLVGSSFVDVPVAEVIGGPTVTVTSDAADNIIAGGIGYVGARRFVRAVITGTTNTNAVVRILFLRGKPHRAPTEIVGATVATT